MGLKLEQFDSARSFLERTGPFLERDEAGNNLLIGLGQMVAQQEAKDGLTAKAWFGAVENSEGNLVLVMLLNSLNMIVAGEGPELEQAVQLAVDYIYQSGREMPGVVGPVEAAGFTAREWASIAGKTAYVKMNQRIYRLDRVNPVASSPGNIRAAVAGDMELVTDWIYEFAESIREKMSREEAAAKASDNIRSGSLYIWEDGRPVSMAKKARPTRNGVVISLVYTPPEYRNKGYATSCVASLSQLLLDEGFRFCSLYTDLSNPTSNAIYAKIGYTPVQDSILYRFK